MNKQKLWDSVVVDNAQIKQVTDVKFLGAHLDEHLNWKTHCVKLSSLTIH